MPRVVLSLLPIPALALLFALSCTRTRSEEPVTQVIAPAAPYLEPAAPSAAPPAPYLEPAARNAAAAAAAPRAVDAPPSPEEVEAFERPVAK